MSAARGNASSVAAFLLIALIWGSTWLVIKDQISAVPLGWTVTWRFLLAAIGMFALALVRRDPLWLEPAAMRLAVMVGLFQFFGNFQLVYRSEHYLASGLVAVMFALLLVPNAVLARVFLGARMTARFLAGSAVALGGIAMLLIHEYRAAPAGEAVLTGAALVCGALLCASTSNVLLAGPLARRQPAVPLIGWAMVWGTLADALFAWVTTGAPQFDPRPQYVWGVVYLALIGSVVTFPLYFALIRDWGPGKAAYNGVLVPVVAMALSTAFEGYRWTALAAAGSVLALSGLLIALGGREARG